jgi:hypothetical protein
MADDAEPDVRADEDLIVNLNDDDTPPAGEKAPAVAAKPPPVPGPSSTPPAETGLQDLQRQVNAERAERARVEDVARRIAAERDQAIAFAQEAERRGVSTYELYNENQIRAAQDKMEALAAQAEQAMQDGDFRRASNLNLQLGRMGGALAVLERDQAILAQQREQAMQQPPPRVQQPQPQPQPQRQLPADPLERAIQGRSEPAKQFLRKHPELVRGDGTIKRQALDAHDRALDEGFVVDTPGYFEFIERSVMAQQPGNQAGNQQRAPLQSGQRAPTMAAPVSRDTNGSGVVRSDGTFQMTAKMRRLAEEQGVTPQEWAKNYVRLLAEGRITPIT